MAHDRRRRDDRWGGALLSDVSLDALGLRAGEPIAVRIGIHPDATNVGGINIFGRGFGNYPQDSTCASNTTSPTPTSTRPRRIDERPRRRIAAAAGPARELDAAADG